LPVLVVNAGSTSLKLSLVDDREDSEQLDSFGAAQGRATAVGHRVVHGGRQYRQPVQIDDEVERNLGGLTELAPLHNGPAVDAIHAARTTLPDVPHVAVFDTAFHATMPPEATTYALPERFREDWGIRRYGFHGLSVAWAASRVPVSRLVVCHLGGGCSVTAVRDGESVDTSMGFTPLEGVPMATRSGSVDPGALLHVLRRGLVTLEELDRSLEHESGLVGLGGTDDLRTLEGSLAFDVYTYRIALAVGAMAAALGGIDALVFTAGVGEHSAAVRARVCARIGFLGVELDVAAYRRATRDAEIATAGSPVRVVVLRSREDVMAARAVRTIVRQA
jgi:acetate kinase